MENEYSPGWAMSLVHVDIMDFKICTCTGNVKIKYSIIKFHSKMIVSLSFVQKI